VDEAAGEADLAPERLDDHLVPEADAEDRHPLREAPDDLHRVAGIGRPPGAGRDEDMAR